MRASSSWIKLQFVVRKHVMNTYQMHTLSLFLFYHIFSISLGPVSDFFCLLDSYSVSPAHSLPVFLMVCHIDVTCSAVLYNVALCIHMWMHMCVFTFIVENIHDRYLRVSCIVLMLITCLCLRPLWGPLFQLVLLFSVCLCVCVCVCAFNGLALTLSQASVGMSSFAGCSAAGQVRCGGQEGTRIRSDWL